MDLKKKLSMLKDTGKVDGEMSGKNVGKVLDMYNEQLQKKKNKEFDKKVHDRNMYFVPLIRHALKHGPGKAYESSKTLVHKDS